MSTFRKGSNKPMRSSTLGAAALAALVAVGCTNIFGSLQGPGAGGSGGSSSSSSGMGAMTSSSSTGSSSSGMGAMTSSSSTGSSSSSTTSSTSSTSTSSTSSGMGCGASCTSTECDTATCNGSTCVMTPVGVGTPLMMQTPGTCQQAVCDGKGGTAMQVDNANVPTSTNPCTKGICTNGVPSMMNLPPGTSCSTTSSAKCDSNGNCVGCLTAADCPMTGNPCINPVCNTGGVCGTTNVTPNTQGGCPAGQACSASQTCELANGLACSTTIPCLSGNCSTDDVCCATACTGPCNTCVGGTCGLLATGAQGGCPANEACNPNGVCEGVNGQPCTMGSQCVSNNCSSGVDQFCCSSACTGACSSCAGGTCKPVPAGSQGACPANNTCNAMGNCVPVTYTLTVNFTGPSGGTVVIQPGNATCTSPNPCTTTVNAGTGVTITAKPSNPGTSVTQIFSGWTGACSAVGLNRVCAMTINAATTTTAVFNTLSNNFVFVSSTTQNGNYGSAAAAQAQCNTLATAAGINNSSGNAYVAWMQATGYNSITLVGTARAWVRADTQPWIDNMSTALSTGIVYYPAAYDENGARVIGNTWSGMVQNGTIYSGATCTDWSATSGLGATGHTHASGYAWPMNNEGVSQCTNQFRLLCVMANTSRTAAISPVAVPGKKIWLSNASWAPGGGLTGGPTAADSVCLASAPAGVTAAKAILQASTRTLASVLPATTVYVRPDGTKVGTGADIVTALTNFNTPATLEGGIIQSGNGTYIAGMYPTIMGAWTGVSTTCSDWTSTASTVTGTIGAETGWGPFSGNNANWACNMGNLYLRCAEQ